MEVDAAGLVPTVAVCGPTPLEDPTKRDIRQLGDLFSKHEDLGEGGRTCVHSRVHDATVRGMSFLVPMKPWGRRSLDVDCSVYVSSRKGEKRNNTKQRKLMSSGFEKKEEKSDDTAQITPNETETRIMIGKKR